MLLHKPEVNVGLSYVVYHMEIFNATWKKVRLFRTPHPIVINLALYGYKSYSNIANISWLDRLRVNRHKSKYYVVNIFEEEANEALKLESWC